MESSSTGGSFTGANQIIGVPMAAPFIRIMVSSVTNGFVIELGYQKHVAKDKKEVLEIITEYLK